MIEEPLQIGEAGRIFAILTQPTVLRRDTADGPLFVFLSAGLLHRVGPHRLHVHLARALASMGFRSLRVDQSGKGDSPRRANLPDIRAVEADYEEIVSTLESRFGTVRLVLAGLCSGADDAIRLAIQDSRVIGLFLMDPYCPPGLGYRVRVLSEKFLDPRRYMSWLIRRMRNIKVAPAEPDESEDTSDPLLLRDLPSEEQLRAAFKAVCDRHGRALSVFTEYSTRYYNRPGQLRRMLNVAGYDKSCTELFWRFADHTYSLEMHRRRLEEEFKNWAAGFMTMSHKPGGDTRTRTAG